MPLSKKLWGGIIINIISSVFLYSPHGAIALDDFNIHIFFFKSILMESRLQNVQILTASQRPELSGLKEKAAGFETEMKAAAINALVEIYGLQNVEEVFSFQKLWDGKTDLFDDIALGKLVAYRFRLSPKAMPDQRVVIHAMISRTKEGYLKSATSKEQELSEAYKATRKEQLMDVLIEQDIVLMVGDPVIVSAPFKSEAYFAMLLLTSGSRIEPGQEAPTKEKKEVINLTEIPKAIVQIQPFYPQELRRRRIGGEIRLRITIDEKGNVLGVDIERQLHPYLNYTAVQAFLKWKFEAVLRNGKPARAMFGYTYNFDPFFYLQERTWSEDVLSGSASSLEELRRILGRCGEYCQKLSGAVMDFICEETIKETHYNLVNNIRWATLLIKREQDSQGTLEIVKSVRIMDPKLTIHNVFLCDYQIVRKGDDIGEARIILNMNRRRLADRNTLLTEKRFTGLSPLFAPLRVLAKDRQPLFNFKLLDEEKIHGKKAFVIEAVPKSGNEDGIWSARIWVDRQSYGILRCEVEGVPIDGYEDVLKDCAILNIKPNFMTTHEYQVEKNSICFPSRSEVHVFYPAVDIRGPIEKIGISLAYNKYKFFTVETESKIIK